MVYPRIITILCFVAASLVKVCNAQQMVTWKELDEKAAHIQSAIYKTTTDTTLKIYYLKPENLKPNEKLPAIIWIHGGAWTGGTASTFFEYAAYFSLRGAVGISIEYRLMTNEKSDIHHCIIDCKSAIRFIKQHAKELNINPNKIIICGESAGGHLAACMALLNDNNDLDDDSTISTVPQALVLLNPVVNVAANNFIKYMDAGLLKPKNGLPDSITLATKYLESAKKISPLCLVKKALPPSLIITGLEDKVTPPWFAEAFADSVNRFKNNCRLVLLPNTGHAFAVPRYKSTEAEVVKTITQIDQYLIELRFLKGSPILTAGKEPAWMIKK